MSGENWYSNCIITEIPVLMKSSQQEHLIKKLLIFGIDYAWELICVEWILIFLFVKYEYTQR